MWPVSFMQLKVPRYQLDYWFSLTASAMKKSSFRFALAALLGLAASNAAMAQAKDASECKPPEFPSVVWDIGSGGTVTLRFLVDEKGNVIESYAQASSGIPLIDKTGKEAIERCRFAPKMVDGYPTQQWLGIIYVFNAELSEPALKQLRDGAKGGNWHAAAQLAHAYLDGRAGRLEWSPGEAIKLLETAAERNAASAYELGMYLKGDKQPQAARTALQRSADKGYPAGQHELAQLFADKKSPGYNEKEASRWFLKAAENGYREAQEEIAWRFLSGTGVTQDAGEALAWASKAALQQGVSEATVKWLGDHYRARNEPAKALEYYQLAANRNSYRAMHSLGMLLLAGGKDVEKDEETALRWLNRSAELGYAPAQNQLGWQLLPKKDPKAYYWLYKAAKQGEPEAQQHLGYDFTLRSTDPARQTEGVMWLRRGAASSHVGSMFFLGYALANGIGAATDMAEARKWYEKAAAAGYADALFNLGKLQELGQGGPQNVELALSQYQKAAAKGQAEAIGRLGTVYEKGELGQAVDAAQAKFWREKLPKPNKS